MNDRLQIAMHLLANSPWHNAGRNWQDREKLMDSAFKFADAMVVRMEQTQPPKKRWFPFVRQFFRFLVERIYR